jgi:hypothetical protein
MRFVFRKNGIAEESCCYRQGASVIWTVLEGLSNYGTTRQAARLLYNLTV